MKSLSSEKYKENKSYPSLLNDKSVMSVTLNKSPTLNGVRRLIFPIKVI